MSDEINIENENQAEAESNVASEKQAEAESNVVSENQAETESNVAGEKQAEAESNAASEKQVEAEDKKKGKKEKKKKKQKSRFRAGFTAMGLTFLCFIMFTSCNWVMGSFGHLSIETMLYQMTLPIGGANSSVATEFVTQALIPSLIAMAVAYFVVTFICYKHFKYIHYAILYICLGGAIAVSFFYCNAKMSILECIANAATSNTLYEENYVDPSEVNITFPEQKKNLILVYLESMETTHADEENGGVSPTNYIPNLTNMANNNICFSDKSDRMGGYYSTAGSGFTYGAMIATASGLPYGLPNGHDLVMTEDSKTMEKVTTMGDILKEQGYNQVYMCGSFAKFSGRDSFYKTHGDYELCDLKKAREDGVVPPDYMEFWGFEDEILYDYAKDKITELASKDEPFNFTMLTVDTHHPNGYVCKDCKNEYPYQYANVVKCADNRIEDFINWCKEQDFYENTAIVLIGDHISMASEYFEEANINEDDRRVYNCFINCDDILEDAEYTKNRTYTSMDLFPTILATLGAKIDGNKLGIGTNLFTGEKTLAEQFGIEELRKDLTAWSTYYYDSFVKSE